MNWYVIYTKSRSEKKVAERLAERGFTVYCPLRKEVRIWSDRKKNIEVPVFSSYAFVCVDEVDRYKVLEVPGVVNFVFWLGKPAIVRNKELASIRTFLSDYPQATANSVSVEKGQKVQVTYGQLKDQYGTITEVRNNRVVLQLDNIGFELMAEISLNQIALTK